MNNNLANPAELTDQFQDVCEEVFGDDVSKCFLKQNGFTYYFYLKVGISFVDRDSLDAMERRGYRFMSIQAMTNKKRFTDELSQELEFKKL